MFQTIPYHNTQVNLRQINFCRKLQKNCKRRSNRSHGSHTDPNWNQVWWIQAILLTLDGVACLDADKCSFSKVFKDTCLVTNSDTRRSSKTQPNGSNWISTTAFWAFSWTILRINTWVHLAYIALPESDWPIEENLVIGMAHRLSATCYMRSIKQWSRFRTLVW